MGRPRKRQREEVREAQDMNGDPGPSRDFDLTGGDNPLQGRGVSNQIPLPEDEYGSNGFQNGDYDQIGSFHNNSEIGFDPFRNDALNFELPHGPVSEPILDLSSLDPSQDFSKYFPDISKTPNNMVQLQTQYTNAEADTAGVQPVGTNTTGCACLPNLYSTLGSFHRMPPPSFPYSIGALKKAVNLGREVVRCQNCTQTYNTAIQNSTMLSALVQMIVHEYAKLLKYIDERAAKDEKIAFRVGEMSSPFDSRHTGGPDCPMAINIDLNGEEWRTIAKKAVRQEVLGGDKNRQSLIGLVHEMRERQEKWHGSFSTGEACFNTFEHMRTEQPCAQVLHLDHVKKSLEAFKF
ncbi:hypothetical protein MMC28_001245 [Mycoblastus sanguinarius]|nr:hypothetical protein [Mycoblastus sanguinarius]